MRIAILVTVEMSPAQVADYCDYNGIDRDEIRQDVRTYIRTTLQGSPAFAEIDADVTVR